MINPAFQPQLPIVIELLKKHKVKNAYLFGSVTTDKFNENSDIDLLINLKKGLPPLKRGELLLDLWDKLEEQLNRKVDLLTETSLKNPYFIEEINEKRVLFYGEAS